MNKYELFDIQKDKNKNLSEKAIMIAKEHNLDKVIITNGKEGAFIINRQNGIFESKTKKIEVVDTVGAGDAFSAIIILGIVKEWSESEIIKRATEFSAAMCEVQGAIFSNTNIYDKFLWKWKNNS